MFSSTQVRDTIVYFENRQALNGSVITLDENSNPAPDHQSTPARQESFPSFNFPEDYSTPVASRVIQSGVSREADMPVTVG